jgi:predicted nicotinamide N-methyase
VTNPRKPFSSRTSKRTMRELCPRSYDVVERAELQSLRLDLFDDETRENPVTVIVRQDPDVGIPGVVYDCAMHLAAFVVDEVFPKKDASFSHKDNAVSRPEDEEKNRPVRVLELGAGTGACGCLLAAACARRNVEIHLTLTDRKPAALALCAANLAANLPEGSRDDKKHATRRYAFGDPVDDLLLPVDDTDDTDASDKNEARDDARGPDETTNLDAAEDGRTRQSSSSSTPRLFDVILASDVLYDESSAVPLAETLCELLKTRRSRWNGDTKTANEEEETLPSSKPTCFLAWRPRAATPHKASAVASFAAACASRKLRVRDAAIFGSREKIASATVKVLASDANEANGRGWSESLTARDAAEHGVRVLAIDAMEDG